MNHYTPLLQKLPIPALLVGNDGIARIVSEPAVEMGYQQGESIEQKWFHDFLVSSSPAQEVLIECQSIWWQVQMKRVEDGVVVVATDVSSQIVIQQAMTQASEEQAALSREILRHDAATFLNNIGNSLTILAEDPTSSRLIEKAQASVEKLRALLESFAYLYGAGRSKRRLLVFRELVEHCLNELELTIEKKRAVISIEGNGTMVWGDASRLGQVIENLIRNALHYQPDDESHTPRVDIEIFPDDEEEGFVILEIKDNGIGIAPEHHESVFHARTRLHSTQEYSGSGLGLAIVKQIVSEHGGELGLSSEPTNGSKFWVRLPRSSEHLTGRR